MASRGPFRWSPDQIADLELPACLENVVGTENVVSEGHGVGMPARRRNSRQMHDSIDLVVAGVDPRESLKRLPKVGQVGLNEGAESLTRAGSVHVDDLVAMLKKLTDTCPTCLPATACHKNPLHF
jgi:hypothetical protein